MSTLNINWATVIAVVSGLAGVAGVIITPIWGTALATSVQNILLSLSSALVAISGYHATSVVAATAKVKAAVALTAVAPVPPAA